MHRTGYMAVSDKDGISGIIITGFHTDRCKFT